MNFKQAPLNRATIISHFSAGTSESARRTNVSVREDGKERETKNTGERGSEREIKKGVTVTDSSTENHSCDYMMSNVF